jgi:hypothetical protein
MRFSLSHPERHLVPFVCNVSLGRVAAQAWRERALRGDDADVFLVSFPKSGRTWLRFMINATCARHFGVDLANYLDMRAAVAAIPGMPKIHVMHDDEPQWKTPRQLLTSKREFGDRSVLFLVRDPRDVVVSQYFHLTKRIRLDVGDLSAFLRSRKGSLQTIVRYYNLWAERRDVPKDFLLVRYEDLHASAFREMRRILAFLQLRDVSDAAVDEGAAFSSFDNMRAMEARDAMGASILRPGDPKDPESFKVRKGIVGGYSGYLSERDIAYADDLIARELSGVFGYGTAAEAREPVIGSR